MITFTPTTKAPKFVRYMQSIWMPFYFSLFLCVIVETTGMFPRSGITIQTAFPTFFGFLPMVFFFIALSTQSQITRLEKRINDLETKLSDAKKG
jgi:predicted PurR-regulated permease PerM